MILAVVGRLGTVWGGVVGAVVVLAVLFMARGMVPSVDRAFDRVAAHRRAGEPA